jgi:hypothetical protein
LLVAVLTAAVVIAELVVVGAAGEKLWLVLVGAAAISGFVICEVVVSADVLVPLDGDEEVEPAPAEIVWVPNTVFDEPVVAGGGVLEPIRVEPALPPLVVSAELVLAVVLV